MVCSLLGCVDCAAAQSAPQTGAEAFILMDAGSGRVLTGKNTEQELAIASTTKIMTALVALETGNLSDKVTVKQNHLKEGSSMYLRAGEVLTLEELLYGLLLPSGNDAAEHDAHLVREPERTGRAGTLFLRARHGAARGVCHA